MKKQTLSIMIIFSLFTFVNLCHANMETINCHGDINGDCKIGIAEAISILQTISGYQKFFSEEKIKALEDIVTYNTLTLAKNSNKLSGLNQLADIASYIGLTDPEQLKMSSISDIVEWIKNYNSSCASINLENLTTAVISFDNKSDCNGISGTVKITPSLSNGELLYQIEYINLQNNDCIIEGNTLTTISRDMASIVITHKSDNLKICDQSFNGTIIITYGLFGLVSIEVETDNTYLIDGVPINGQSKVVYSPSKGLSGTTTLSVQDENFQLEFNDITIDTACGIPTSGTLIINDIKMDFSNTDCSNPMVEFTVDGKTYSLSIEDAKNIYLGLQQENTESLETVINYASAAIAENSQIAPGVDQISNILSLMGIDQITQRKKRNVSVSDILTTLNNFDFQCGTMTFEDRTTLIYTFANLEQCNNISGTIKITPQLTGGLSFLISFENVVTNDCTINGQATMTLTFENNNIKVKLIAEDLLLCGQSFNGTLSLTYILFEGVIIDIQSENSFVINDQEINGQSDMTYSKTDGLSGTSHLSINGESFALSYDHLTVDYSCGIPTSGTMVLNGIEFNFSETSCENPVVSCTINGKTYTMSLEAAINFFLSQSQ